MSPNDHAMPPWPRIQSKKLVIRVPERQDAKALITYLMENRDHFSGTDPKRPPEFYSEPFWAERIAQFQSACRADRAVHFYLFNSEDNAEIVGSVELSQIARGPFQACYLGFGVAKKRQGEGLMFEAVGAVIAYAFGELNLHRIMANHLPDNERSARLLARLEFQREGIAQEYLRINGVWRDHVLMSLTNKNWREK